MESVESTRKITRAMEMLSRTKVAAARRRASRFRPYAEHMRTLALRMRDANPEYVSPFLRKRSSTRRIGLIVVSTDRGLCGPLNSHLLLRCAEAIGSWQAAGVEAQLSVVGARGVAPLLRYGAQIASRCAAPSDELHFESFFGAVSVPLNEFVAGNLDEVHIAYNRLESAIAYQARIDKILPIDALLNDGETAVEPVADYLYEPDPKSVVQTLLLRYVEAFVYQAVAENNACEQCARTMAMRAATDNAEHSLRDLKRLYQKTRQAKITTELCEIVSGAAAV